MGIYTDIQRSLSKAFDTNLSDATATITIIEETIGDYNPTSGKPSKTYVNYDMRCVVLANKVGEDLDEPTTTDYVNVLILDSEMTIQTLKIGMPATLRGSNYEIVGLESDPTVSTHTIKLRKL